MSIAVQGFQVGLAEPTQQCARTDIRFTEPGTFFSAKSHHFDTLLGSKSLTAHPGKANDTRHNPGSSVKITSLGHAVKVRSAGQKRLIWIKARQGDYQVGGGIRFCLEVKLFSIGLDQFDGFLLALAIGFAGNANGIFGGCGQIVKHFFRHGSHVKLKLILLSS